MSNRLMQILASLAQRRALRGLDVICETQHQISTRKLEQYLHQIDNELSGHAHYLRIEYDALTSKVATLEAENAKLRAELERRVPDGWKLVPVEPTDEMLESDFISCHCGHDFSPALFDHVWHKMLAAAPSAPKADDSDAANYRWLREQHNNVNSDIGVYDGPSILATADGELDLDAAIAAARQEGGKV